MYSTKNFKRFCCSLFVVTSISSCATYTSACHELSAKNGWELGTMQKKADRSSYERHLILLESGNETSSRCRSYLINADDFKQLPGSVTEKCFALSGRATKYCTIYSVDGEIRNTPVEL